MRLKKTYIKYQAQQGEEVEWYYGYGYTEYQSNTVFVYVIPLNLFVQLGRWMHWKLRKAYHDKDIDAYKDGFRDGKQAGRDEYEKELGQALRRLVTPSH